MEPCDRVAVVGDGKLGLLIAEVLGRHVHALTPKAPPLVLLGRHTSKMGLLSADAGVETALAADALPARAACFDVVVDELKVVGSRCGPFPPALKLLECGLDLTKLIDATYPLAEAADAVAKAATKGTMKVQIRVSAD